MSESLWQRRYQELVMELECLSDTIRLKRRFEVSVEPCSASKEFFISNDMDCVDNETYALEYWGPGKYRRVVLDEAFKLGTPDPKGERDE
jgi:hypothetical protein